jgi:hypothetical protein
VNNKAFSKGVERQILALFILFLEVQKEGGNKPKNEHHDGKFPENDHKILHL